MEMKFVIPLLFIMALSNAHAKRHLGSRLSQVGHKLLFETFLSFFGIPLEPHSERDITCNTIVFWSNAYLFR